MLRLSKDSSHPANSHAFCSIEVDADDVSMDLNVKTMGLHEGMHTCPFHRQTWFIKCNHKLCSDRFEGQNLVMRPHARNPLKVTLTRYHPERFARIITQLSDF